VVGLDLRQSSRVHSFLLFFLVVLQIRDRKSSWIVKCLCGVRSSHRGLTIKGSIGAKACNAGASKVIPLFPGRRVFRASALEIYTLRCKIIRISSKMHLIATGLLIFIIGWSLVTELATRRFYGFPHSGQNPCIYNIYLGHQSSQKSATLL
jgi:hypothetical protein